MDPSPFINQEMNNMKTNSSFILIALISILSLFCVSCKHQTSSFKDFSFSYTMQSVNAYTVTTVIDSKKNCQIRKENIFMNRVEKSPTIKTNSVKLNDNEYKQIVTFLKEAELFDMKDSYGFDSKTVKNTDDFILQIVFKADGREKFITIKGMSSAQFNPGFVKLIKSMNDLMNRYGQ